MTSQLTTYIVLCFLIIDDCQGIIPEYLDFTLMPMHLLATAFLAPSLLFWHRHLVWHFFLPR